MDREKIIALLRNREFVDGVNTAKNEEELLALFADNGCVLTADELRKMIKKPEGSLNADELAAVSGGRSGDGTVCFFLGVGYDGYDDKPNCYGIGLTLCVAMGDGLVN